MKRNILNVCLSALALSGLVLVSCSKDEGGTTLVSSPAITVSTTAVSASYGGGTYSFTYTLTNASADGTVSCSADVSWLSNFNTATSGSVSFTVAENTGETVRTGNITVTYNYTEDGVAQYVTEKVGVVQGGSESPELSVQPTAVTASYSGGTYSFNYDLYNEVDDGVLTATSSEGWITDFDYSSYGIVSFTVAANSGTELRSATITVEYAYDNTSITKEVTVIQDHPGTGGSTGGGGDVSSVIGTYTAKGHYYYYGSESETEWTLKIYEYDGSATTGNYDVYIDGLLAYSEGSYDYYGDHRASAGATVNANGSIVVPSQVLNCQISTDTANYYICYTPCVSYEDGSYYYSGQFPDLVFTYNSSTGQYVANYGEFFGGATTLSVSTSSFAVWVAAVNPNYEFTLTKTSDTTAATSSVQNAKVGHPITEGLVPMTNVKAQ